MIKKVMFFVIALSLISSLAFAAYVKGYYRKNGTYVSGYNRSSPNYTVQDNYSYKGNSNPYTGMTGTNYYRNNPTSAYYGTSKHRTATYDTQFATQ